MNSDRKLDYIEEFDAFCYLDTGEWEEPACDDPTCKYCTTRPETAHGYMLILH